MWYLFKVKDKDTRMTSLTLKIVLVFPLLTLNNKVPAGFIFEENSDIKFTRYELQKPFRIATPETHFLFNTIIFDQIDIAAIDSPFRA